MGDSHQQKLFLLLYAVAAEKRWRVLLLLLLLLLLFLLHSSHEHHGFPAELVEAVSDCPLSDLPSLLQFGRNFQPRCGQEGPSGHSVHRCP